MKTTRKRTHVVDMLSTEQRAAAKRFHGGDGGFFAEIAFSLIPDGIKRPSGRTISHNPAHPPSVLLQRP
jgi:hypothetical protein